MKINDLYAYLKKKLLAKNIFVYLVFTFILIYLTFFIIIPFFKYNHLISWDMIGHYFSAWYQKEYLFPDITGWNPFFFAGYPQNQFYNPLFSYLVSALSFIMPIDIAFKTLLSIIILSTPFSFYYFSKSFKISNNSAATSTILMFLVLFLFKDSLGGDIQSTFEIGLVTHSLGLLLFFFYFGSILNAINNKKSIILPSILLSLIILSHIVVAFAALVALLSIALSKIKDMSTLKFFSWHAILSFLLTSFWTLPFIFKNIFVDSIKIGTDNNYFSAILLFVLIYTLISIYKNDKNTFPITIFLLILAFISIVGIGYVNLNFHFYRLILFFFLFIPISILTCIKKEKKLLYLLILVISIFIIISSNASRYVINQAPSHIENMKNEIDINSGRTLILARMNEEIAPHYLQNQIILDNKILGIKGLFVESSKSSRFLLNLEREIDNKSFSWGTYIYSDLINQSIKEKILSHQLNLFQINYIISKDDNSLSNWEMIKYVSEYEGIKYYLYKVGNYSLIEILNYTPEIILDNDTISWFLSEEVLEGIRVYEKVPNNVPNNNNILNIVNISKRQDNIRLYVNSTDIVPILIKISYFPNWKAYQNGKEIKIYKASPNFMLIYAKGDIEIKYSQTNIDKISNILTIIGLLTIIYLIIKRYKRI